MGCVYLQLCKITRLILGQVENGKWDILPQSSTGVAASGHSCFCVARSTLDASRSCRCGLGSGGKASGFNVAFPCGLRCFEKHARLERGTVPGPVGTFPRGPFLWGEGMTEWENEWMKGLSLPALIFACTLWLGGRMPCYSLLWFTRRSPGDSWGKFEVCVCAQVGAYTHVHRPHSGGPLSVNNASWHSPKHGLQWLFHLPTCLLKTVKSPFIKHY